MIILGIDPGYARLGYAILKKDSQVEKLIASSCIETSPKEKHSERILKLAKKVEKLIEKYKPNILAIEKLYFTTNQKTALKVAEIKGIVLYIALKNKLKTVEYTPLEIKVAVCGYGKAPKEQVKKMVKLLLNLKKNLK